jgi:hypothetical protein
MNHRAADLEPRHRAMLDFAVRVTDAPWSIEEEHRGALRVAASPTGHLGHRRRGLVLQHVEPHGLGHRHAPERGVSRAGRVRDRPPPPCGRGWGGGRKVGADGGLREHAGPTGLCWPGTSRVPTPTPGPSPQGGQKKRARLAAARPRSLASGGPVPRTPGGWGLTVRCGGRRASRLVGRCTDPVGPRMAPRRRKCDRGRFAPRGSRLRLRGRFPSPIMGKGRRGGRPWRLDERGRGRRADARAGTWGHSLPGAAPSQVTFTPG